MSDKREEFKRELKELLTKYQASISADDHWTGYPECGQDVRITVEFQDYNTADIEYISRVDWDD